jgi:ABC-type transport system substrate-binding protein
MKQDWDKIKGLNVTLTIEENAQTSLRIAKRDYPGLLNSAMPETPRAALPVLTSTSPQNLSYINDPELDAALVEANATNDPSAQTAAMKKVSQRLAALVPYITQYRTPFNFFWKKNVHGVQNMLTSGATPMQNVWKDS